MSIFTTNVTAISPDQIEALVVQPVASNSVAIQAATLITTGATVTRIPRVTQDPTASWVAEGAEIGASDPTIDDVEIEPSKLAGLTVVTNEAAADTSPAAAGLIGDGLARDIARKLDAAFFGSRGVSTIQPAGLGDLVGFGSIAAGTTWTNADAFAEAMANAEALGLLVNTFVANPADALLLAQLKESTGSNRPLLGSDPTNPTRRVLQGVPLLVSPAVAAGTVWGIPKIRAVVVRRTNVELAIDKSAYFTSDRTAIRATMRVGFGFTDPSAIQKITIGA